MLYFLSYRGAPHLDNPHQMAQLASARSDKAARLARDEAVHAALIKRKVRRGVGAVKAGFDRGRMQGTQRRGVRGTYAATGRLGRRLAPSAPASPPPANHRLQEEIERQELRVELALSEKARRLGAGGVLVCCACARQHIGAAVKGSRPCQVCLAVRGALE